MRVIFLLLLLSSTVVAASSWFFVKSGVASNYLLDTFQGVNGTALESHTMNTGPGWTKFGNTAEIQSNMLAGKAANIDPAYVSDGGVTEGTLTANLTLDLTDVQVNLYLGTNGSGSSAVGYIVICYPVASLIQFYQSGVIIQQAQVYTAGAQEWKAVLTSSALTFYINGVQIMTSPVAAAAGTFYGLEMYHPAGIPSTTWSSFKLTP